MIGRRYQWLFERLGHTGTGALVPFALLGDPDYVRSARRIDRLIEAGADALELGFPFSDPIADGPVIQEAAARALAAGATVSQGWRLVAEIRERHPAIPIGLLVYANLVGRRGPDRFYGEARDAGVDALLIADVPLEESEPFTTAAERAGIAPVLIVPPNAPSDVVRRIAARTRGYSYVTARDGVTGEGTAGHRDLAERLRVLRAFGAPPPLVGFGISTPADVRAVMAAGAAGAIVGSAIVRRFADADGETAPSEEATARFVALLKAATRPVDPIATFA